MTHIFAIAGSLRATSINRQFLIALSKLLPSGTTMEIFDGLADIAPFNFDHLPRPPEPVKKFREKIAAADAVIIASPEYAHGVTGVMKNALDWTVPSGEFVTKPTSLPNCSFGATIAHAALFETLQIMDAWLIIDACDTVHLENNAMSADEILANPTYAEPMRDMLSALLQACPSD